MSQHLFDAFAAVTPANPIKRPVEVFCGWDPPEKRHFLVIEDLSDEAQELPFPKYLFSNLDLPGGGDMTVEDVVARLLDFGISVPDGLAQELDQDKAENKGPGRKHW